MKLNIIVLLFTASVIELMGAEQSGAQFGREAERRLRSAGRKSPGSPIRQLIEAIYDNDLSLVQKILATSKIDINGEIQINGQTVTPLYVALAASPAIADFLLTQPNIDVNKPSGIEGLTPLMQVSSENDPEIVKKLLVMGAHVNAKSKLGGMTALHFASQRLRSLSQKQPSKIITLLLDHKADVNAKDKYGNTPLFYARFPVDVQTLILAGANPNIQNEEGDTPLISDMRNVVILDRATLLLEMGANPLITNKKGENAFTVSSDAEPRRIWDAKSGKCMYTVSRYGRNKELFEFYEKLKKEKMAIHKAARTPAPLTEQEQKAVTALTPEEQAKLVKVPTHAPGIPSLIASYLGELYPEEQTELREELAQEQAAAVSQPQEEVISEDDPRFIWREDY